MYFENNCSVIFVSRRYFFACGTKKTGLPKWQPRRLGFYIVLFYYKSERIIVEDQQQQEPYQLRW